MSLMTVNNRFIGSSQRRDIASAERRQGFSVNVGYFRGVQSTITMFSLTATVSFGALNYIVSPSSWLSSCRRTSRIALPGGAKHPARRPFFSLRRHGNRPCGVVC